MTAPGSSTPGRPAPGSPTPGTLTVTRFDDWRDRARDLLLRGVEPEAVRFVDARADQPGLLAFDPPSPPPLPSPSTPASPPRVPRRFLPLARRVACHRDPDRFDLLYRLLWRVSREPGILGDPLDGDVRRAQAMAKAVGRDIHKMHAFVRFRCIETADAGEHYIAFHRPDHFITREAATFFRDRFRVMRWTILTPDECAAWDPATESLTFTPGVSPGLSAEHIPTGDDLETLWLTYYGAIYNPARTNLRAMTRELPARHWRTLPETRMIPQLLAEAPARVDAMVRTSAMAKKVTAADFIPPPEEGKASGGLTLPLLAKAVQRCEGCDLCCAGATQAVFGEGSTDAKVIMVGEQPGDQEDLAGRPFVGPAGQLLDRVMQEVGLDRSTVYVTNAVKHFKFTQRGKRRLHQTPNVTEVKSCRPWLEKEIELIQPPMLVALGATAAKSLFGQGFRITRSRGEVFPSEWAKWSMATLHPSALLRMPDAAAREAAEEAFISDLGKVAKRLAKHAK